MIPAKRRLRSIFAGGQFTILTGIGGEAWEEAAEKVGPEFGHADPRPRDRPAQAYTSTTPATGPARARSGHGLHPGAPGPACLLARRGHGDDPEGELRRVLTTILAR
jgi:2,4-dichlorophenol 6-monooxygenase